MADPQLSYVAVAILALSSLGGLVAWLSRPPGLHARAASPDPRGLPGGPAEDDALSGARPHFRLVARGESDPGLVRKTNEDAFALAEDHALFVVADGMGRHAAGEVASEVAVASVLDAYRKGSAPRNAALPPCSPHAAALGRAFLLANERVYSRAQQADAYRGMGTTLVAARFFPRSRLVHFAHVGDSRCYRVRRGEVTQLTADHTLPELPVQGKRRTLLSRAVGIGPSVEVDLGADQPEVGDTYVLCSDGLSSAISKEALAEVLGSDAALDACVSRLLERAKEAGGRDNITVIVIRVEPAPSDRPSRPTKTPAPPMAPSRTPPPGYSSSILAARRAPRIR